MIKRYTYELPDNKRIDINVDLEMTKNMNFNTDDYQLRLLYNKLPAHIVNEAVLVDVNYWNIKDKENK